METKQKIIAIICILSTLTAIIAMAMYIFTDVEKIDGLVAGSTAISFIFSLFLINK